MRRRARRLSDLPQYRARRSARSPVAVACRAPDAWRVRLQVRAHPADRCKVPQAFWRTLDHLGLRPAAVLRQARLPSTLHLSTTGLVFTAQLFAIWKAVQDLANDPEFGFKMVKASDQAGHQPAFLAAHYAADFGDAIARIDRFERLSSCELFRFDEQHGEFSISKEWPYTSEPEPAVLVDTSFPYLLESWRRGTGHKIVPLRVELARPDTFRLVYGDTLGCPVRYSAPRNVIIGPRSSLPGSQR